MNYFGRPGVEFKMVGKKQTLKEEIIISNVCEYYGLTKKELLSRVRLRNYVEARGIIAYILLYKAGLSSVNVGKILNRSHASILHHAKKVHGFMEFDKEYKELVNSFV